jgi:hypothetical protein
LPDGELIGDWLDFGPVLGDSKARFRGQRKVNQALWQKLSMPGDTVNKTLTRTVVFYEASVPNGLDWRNKAGGQMIREDAY